MPKGKTIPDKMCKTKHDVLADETKIIRLGSVDERTSGCKHS